MSYKVVQSSEGYRAYGAAREFWRYKGHEVLLSGPYETGKTLGALHKCHALLCKYPRARLLMIRKTYKSLTESAIKTFEHKVLPAPPEQCGINKIGGTKPTLYQYPNGSEIILGGLDKAGKVLSAEYDYIYVCQMEEILLEEYEVLIQRASGRAGNVPYPQVIGDCNPGPPHHWILHRENIKRLESRHKDNPTLFHPITGQITEQGERSIALLKSMTGVRLLRGFYGKWAGAEGMVYDAFDEAVHLIYSFDVPQSWKRYRVIDFGFTNPFVCQWWAEDHDGRLYLYREIYMTQRTVSEHVRGETGKWEGITDLSFGEQIRATICDHDAEDRATLRKEGIRNVAANKPILPGIDAVKQRLKVQRDGKPRLFIMRGALVEVDLNLKELRKPYSTAQEFTAYVWGSNTKKDLPLDEHNHGMDAMRYLIAHVDGIGKKRGGSRAGAW